MILIIMLIISVISFIKLSKQYESTVYAFKIQDSGLPDNFDELVGEKWGVSDYAVIKGDIRVDIEKTVSEKYYIKYSWINYDNSYFAVNILIENLKREPLQDDKNITAIVTDNRNNTYLPFYCNFSDYPTDTPLYYKKTLFCRYLPINPKATTINVTVHYNGEIFTLKDIPLD